MPTKSTFFRGLYVIRCILLAENLSSLLEFFGRIRVQRTKMVLWIQSDSTFLAQFAPLSWKRPKNTSEHMQPSSQNQISIKICVFICSYVLCLFEWLRGRSCLFVCIRVCLWPIVCIHLCSSLFWSHLIGS